MGLSLALWRRGETGAVDLSGQRGRDWGGGGGGRRTCFTAEVHSLDTGQGWHLLVIQGTWQR